MLIQRPNLTDRPATIHVGMSLLAVTVLISLPGCESSPPASSQTDGDAKRAVISITSDPQADPQAVNMGLTFAGFCVDEGYDVSIFFNVKGVHLPTRTFDPEFRFLEHPPMIETLKTLHGRGVQLHVCPVCMKDMNIQPEDIIEEAFVTDKPKLFAQLGGDTMVFTY